MKPIRLPPSKEACIRIPIFREQIVNKDTPYEAIVTFADDKLYRIEYAWNAFTRECLDLLWRFRLVKFEKFGDRSAARIKLWKPSE